jgi:hypothetical protein
MGFSCFCIECVDTSTVGVLERFGQFQRTLDPVRLQAGTRWDSFLVDFCSR